MKKFKKANSYGQKDRWQIKPIQLQKVCNMIDADENLLFEEDIEAVILALEELGYLELDERSGIE